MMSNRSTVAITVALCLAMSVSGAIAGEKPSTEGWPQYRGPLRDGTAPDRQTPVSWPHDGPRVAWRVPLGSAFSQAAVQGDAVFTGTSDDENEYLVRLDATTGGEMWRSIVGAVFAHNFGNGPRSTPTLDGNHVFLLGANGTLVSAGTSDGAISWKVDLTERFGAQVPRFGYSGSPLIVDDLLLIEVGGKDDTWVAALDKRTGETKWTALAGPAGYSSPLLVEIGGVRQIVMERGKAITALDLEGTILWSYELPEAAIAMPLVAGGDRVFVSSSGDTGCVMLRIEKGEDGFEVKELWKNRNMRNHFNSSVIVGNYLYGFDNATLKCLSIETGELMWAKRGFGKGSIAVSGGRIFVLGDKGRVALVEATSEEYREAGIMQALEGKCWTAPSFSDGRLFLRNLTEMTCLDFRG